MSGFTRFWIILFVALALLFIYDPKIDLQAASLFYKEGTFYLADNPLVQFLYHYSPWFAVGVGIVSLGMLVADFISKKEYFGIRRKVWAYLLLALLLGPGLVVNFVFKEHWGRARPVQVTQFGGEKNFTPAFIPANQCSHNCSFSCGHASNGFYFIALALLAKKHRWLWLTLATLFGFLIGAGRMAQGGHFLSDVIFSFFFVLFTSLLLYRWFFGREEKERQKDLNDA
ncbi:MAG TPA: phosphatase PAP2 family protein [Campylobacteraceae bacterium]|nr:phosphatase PAP2 family protein [Campylobacteraceae bacterium]